MMRYVDGYVVPVLKRNLKKYRTLAMKCGKLWRKYGALEYVECIADDVKKGKSTSFPQSVKLKRGETVVFAYVVYKSRAHRDSVNRRAMNDPWLKSLCGNKSVPFDARRMFWGGFKTLVDA